MTVSTASYLKGHYDTAKAIGAKAVSSDFALEIEGFENMWLLCKQAPWPTLSPSDPVEITLPMGSKAAQPGQLNTYQQGQISMQETVAGSVDNMMINIITRGGTFNAKIYEGTPEKYLRAKPIKDCFIMLDNPDRDWENRSQILLFSGTLHFHYFGEIMAGNSGDYR